MIAFTLTPAAPQQSHYLIAESVEYVDVTGKGFHNLAYNHVVRQYPDGTMTLSAVPTVIASVALSGPKHVGTVAIGDTVTVDGTPYVVTSRVAADPVLTLA